jgi:hypothetical protein
MKDEPMKAVLEILVCEVAAVVALLSGERTAIPLVLLLMVAFPIAVWVDRRRNRITSVRP